MQSAPSDILTELQAYGALPSQLVDLSSDEQPRVLDYLDLQAKSRGWRRPVVVENAGRPCVHVFDGREGVTDTQIADWCWRIALRGDGAWVGVLEPGRLRVHKVDVVGNEVRHNEEISANRGDWALPRFLNDMRAGQNDLARRRYLLDLLKNSAQEAIRQGLSETDALSLVGRGLFWRFLLDRGLLGGLEPNDVCEGTEHWPQCLDRKTRALQTFRWLDETFNGGLLPFETSPSKFPAELFSGLLGNIAHGATFTGQLRLPTEWDEVDFSYVPVGLLSEVYEAFAHNLNAQEASARSIHYTPSHLADFIVTQSLAELPSGSKPRVLDPAVGAGVFLVTTFRKLVEREWLEKGERPGRKRIRAILNKQLVGFDTDTRALRLTELALYLTALELDPKPKPLNELKFENLRDSVLFDLSNNECGSLGPVEDRFQGKFDLVIGNPPWTAIKATKEKKAWVTYSRKIVSERLGKERAKSFDLPDMNPDLPFIWRAMEWAKKGGRIAMVIHARWLFAISSSSTQARNDLIQATRITGILNGSALRNTKVWPNITATWCIVFATNERPEPFDHAAFYFINPALETEADSMQTRMRIDWLDAQIVLASEIVDCPWTLKTRFRGNQLAGRALASMQQRAGKLGDYLQKLGTRFRNGYQVIERGEQLDATHMLGMPDTKNSGPLGFVIDTNKLPKFSRNTLRFPRDPSIFHGPLLLVKESIPSDRLAPRASRTNRDIAYHESYHGVSFSQVERSDLITRYLQLWFQSSAMIFVELLMDGRYGTERDGIHQESLDLLPVVPLDELSAEQHHQVMELSERLACGLTTELADEIDAFVFGTFHLSDIERIAIRDTLETALPSTSSKRRAVIPPNGSERECFIITLQDSLHSVLSASNLVTKVRERKDLRRVPWRFIEVNISHDGRWSDTELPARTFLEEADANGASLVVIRANKSTWFIGLLDRFALWTQTRAHMLATELISERSSS